MQEQEKERKCRISMSFDEWFVRVDLWRVWIQIIEMKR